MFSIQMSIQGFFLSEAKVALDTRKGLFTSMNSNMSHNFLFTAKYFIAIGACKRIRPILDPLERKWRFETNKNKC